MCNTRRRKRKFFDAPIDAISPMKAELRRHYLGRQLEYEARGEWEAANHLNLWLVGAFASFEELMNDDIPTIRRHFLRRLCKAGVI
jgi:hypothetical protein